MIEMLVGLLITALSVLICIVAGYISDKFYMQYTNPILFGDYFILGFIFLIHLGLFLLLIYGIGLVS